LVNEIFLKNIKSQRLAVLNAKNKSPDAENLNHLKANYFHLTGGKK